MADTELPVSVKALELVERFEAAVKANGYRTISDATEKEYEAAKSALISALTTRVSDMRDAEGQALLEEARGELVIGIAFIGRDRGTDRLDNTLDGLVKRFVAMDERIRSATTTPVPDAEGHKRGVEAFQAKYRELAESGNWGPSWPSEDASAELIAAYLEASGTVLCDATPVAWIANSRWDRMTNAEPWLTNVVYSEPQEPSFTCIPLYARSPTQTSEAL